MSAPAAAPRPILADSHRGILTGVAHAAYDLAWVLAILIASPWWLVRCAASARFRRLVRERLGSDLPPRANAPGRARVLIHCVSVGEVKAAQALVRGLASARPELEILLSATTDTGIEVARKLYPGRTIVRFPLDLAPVARRFLARVAPIAVVLVELEIWPAFLRRANRSGVPVVIANGRITQRSVGRYRALGRWLPSFDRLTLVCAQDEDYARRFGELAGSRERVVVTGNLKADGLRVGSQSPEPELARLLGARAGQKTLVAGSTHEPEERLAAEACRRAGGDVRLILVPRHLDRVPSIVRDLTALGRPPQLLSRLRAGEAPDSSRPALVDTMGELERIYALADVAFVGGSLVERGGQNVLEPAAQGKPVVHGPHVWNFAQEAALLERAGASRRVEDVDGLARVLAELFADPDARQRMSAAGIEAVSTQTGAAELTVRALLERCLPA